MWIQYEGEILEIIAGNQRTLCAYTPELYPANLFPLGVLDIKKKSEKKWKKKI